MSDEMTNHNQELFNNMPDQHDYVGTWRDVLGCARKIGLIPDATMEREGGFESMAKLDPDNRDDAHHIIKIMLAMILQARQQGTRNESQLHSNCAGLLQGIAQLAPDDLAEILRQQANTINALSAYSLSAADALKNALRCMTTDDKEKFISAINESVEAKDGFVAACERAIENNQNMQEEDFSDE